MAEMHASGQATEILTVSERRPLNKAHPWTDYYGESSLTSSEQHKTWEGQFPKGCE